MSMGAKNWQAALQDKPSHLPLSQTIAPAAVLILLCGDQDAPSILLTKRASHLHKHAGQIAFPGGRHDDSDADFTQTALREAYEEVGLSSSLVSISGFLPDIYTGTGFRITPLVGQTDKDVSQLSQILVPAADEVERLLFAPADRLLDANAYDSFEREDKGHRWTSWRIQADGEIIWGATAAILHSWAGSL